MLQPGVLIRTERIHDRTGGECGSQSTVMLRLAIDDRPPFQDCMNEHARNICRSIESVSKVLAEWTVSAQFEADPTIEARFGAGSRRRWVADTQSRIGYLAQSLAVRSPELFAQCVLWMREAFTARDSNVADLELNLRCLRDVLATEHAAVVTDAALPCIDHAIEAMRDATPNGHARDQSHGADGPHARLSDAYLKALLEGRGDDAQALVHDAVRSGTSVPEIYMHVLHPAMSEVGRRWQMNEIGVADEHFATAVTQMVMSQMRQHFPRQPRCGRRMLAASVAGDLHEIGVRMVADFFDMNGWHAVFLGANMPPSDLLVALIERDMHLVALSASSVMHLVSLGEAIDAIRTAPGCEQMKILVGGPPFNLVPRLCEEVGADGYAPSAHEAVDIGNRLVSGDAITTSA